MNDVPQLFSDGQAYERLMGRWSRVAGGMFLDWLALPKGLRFLDVGCGNGAFTEVLIAHSAPAAVTGIDPAEGQLAYARTRPGAKPAQFQAGSAQDLPFADGSFDAALMALVISFVPDPAKAVREMLRVVKRGGTVATYMWDIPGGGLPLEPIHAVRVEELVVQLAQPAAPRDRLVEDRPAAHRLDVLAEVADADPLGDRNLSGVRCFLPREHPEQRRLPGPVRAHEADLLPGIQLERGIDQNDATSVLLADA